MARRATVLVDVDEVVFPSAHAYDRWLKHNIGHGLDRTHLKRYDIVAAAGENHDTYVVQFIADEHTIWAEARLPDSVAPLHEMAQTHRLITCTSRFYSDEGEGTTAWLNLHVPELDDIIFIRNIRGTQGGSKADVAANTNAVLLIDDDPSHLVGLSAHCRGALLARPAGLPSADGAHRWDETLQLLPRRGELDEKLPHRQGQGW